MKQIYKEYFQKSKVFLYPLLGIKKGIRFVPIQTYISWDNVNLMGDKLLCLYSIDPHCETTQKQFEVFKGLDLVTHPKYEEYHKINKEMHMFIFDFSNLKKDMKSFREGKYSNFSEITKIRILDFFGKIGTITEYVESYLYPEYYYETYADILNIPIETLMEVGELCDRPDLQEEDFQKQMLEIKLFK
jgi:hypothetical protein